MSDKHEAEDWARDVTAAVAARLEEIAMDIIIYGYSSELRSELTTIYGGSAYAADEFAASFNGLGHPSEAIY